MSLEPLPFYAINAFTAGSPHSGNQAGVVVFPANDARAKDDEYIQQVARDVNYAETAFVEPSSDGLWHLRWFTPEVVGSFIKTWLACWTLRLQPIRIFHIDVRADSRKSRYAVTQR